MAWSQAPGKDFADVNPTLLALLQRAAAGSPYNVSAMSGFRKGDPRQHGRGNATDVQLIDPKSGKALTNYQDPASFKAYQDYANAVYAAASPEQQKALRWGGYFSGGKGKYGALDLMHFDMNSGLPMAGGSFEGGLTPAQAKIWGITPGGGAGGTAPPSPITGPESATAAANPKQWEAAQGEDQPTPLPAGVQGPPTPPGFTPGTTTAAPADHSFREAFSKMVGNFKMPAIAKSEGSVIPPQPAAARVDSPEVPMFDPNTIANQRQQLAMAMQRLNSGKIWG